MGQSAKGKNDEAHPAKVDACDGATPAATEPAAKFKLAPIQLDPWYKESDTAHNQTVHCRRSRAFKRAVFEAKTAGKNDEEANNEGSLAYNQVAKKVLVLD